MWLSWLWRWSDDSPVESAQGARRSSTRRLVRRLEPQQPVHHRVRPRRDIGARHLERGGKRTSKHCASIALFFLFFF